MKKNLAFLCFFLFSLATLLAQPKQTPPMEAAFELQNAFRGVAKKAQPSVVELDITEIIKQKIPSFASPWEFFFGDDFFDEGNNPSQGRSKKEAPKEREFRRSGLGSGIIIKRKGSTIYVVTNNHVIGSANEISVRLTDGRFFPGKVLGGDPRTDIAVITFETKEDVPLAVLADSDKAEVGDIVMAIGNPFGFESTVTQGIISATGRRAALGQSNSVEFIQTDTAINQGNSGGALVNLNGEVVGVNTWIASSSGGSIGLGFAIPSNIVNRVTEEFITKGKVTYGWIGVTIQDVNESFPGLMEDLKLKNNKGALVSSLYKNSPAAVSGLLPGDFITKIGTKAINNAAELSSEVGMRAKGLAVFSLIRAGQERTVNVRIDELQDATTKQQEAAMWPGLMVAPLTEKILKQLSLDISADTGVLVLNSTKQNTIRSGDVIQSINGQKTNSVLEFYRELNKAPAKEILFRIVREGKTFTIGMEQ